MKTAMPFLLSPSRGSIRRDLASNLAPRQRRSSVIRPMPVRPVNLNFPSCGPPEPSSARSWSGGMTCWTSPGGSGGRGRRGQLLLLAGEAGVGKTRLLGAIERKAVAAGFASLRAAARTRAISRLRRRS